MGVREEAIRLLRLGWSVIPLQPRSKLPSGPWAQYSTRLMHPSEVQSAFNEDSNLGIVTGKISGIVVIDIDPKRGGSTDEVLRKYPTGRVVRTGGGGAHLYYRYPRSGHVGNMVDVTPGVDIRGDGGQVVAPPSTHASGSAYVWVQEGALAEFPSDFVKRQTGTKATGTEGWAISLLQNGAAEGTRDDSAAKLSGLLARHEVPEEIACQLLRSWNKARNPDPLPDEDIDKTVKSVYRTDQRRKVTEASSDAFKLLTFEEFMSKNMLEEMNWMVEGWVPDRTILFVVAAPESWKTWITFDLAMSVATGEKFLGKYDVKRPGPVIIIQQEDFAGQTAQRLSVIHYGRTKVGGATFDDDVLVVPDRIVPIYIHPDRKLRFDNPEAMSGLRAAIESVKPVLVIIDPLYSAGSADNYMANLAEEMSPLKGLRDEFGVSFCVVHHAKKNADPSQRERLWGSQFLNAFMEAGWQLSPDGPRGSARVAVSRHFKSAAAQQDIAVQFNVVTHDEGYRYDVEVKDITPGEAPEGPKLVQSKPQVISKLAHRPRGVTVMEAATELGCDRSTAFRVMKKMESDGKIVVFENEPGGSPRYKLTSVVVDEEEGDEF